jgi:predicted transcriptional regulator
MHDPARSGRPVRSYVSLAGQHPPGDTIVQAAKALQELEVGMVPVCDGNSDKRLVGILSLVDVAAKDDPLAMAGTLGNISQPARPKGI